MKRLSMYTETELGSITTTKENYTYTPNIYLSKLFNSKRSGKIPTYKIKACRYLTLLHIA